MSKYTKIVLNGFRATGKSTIARELAKKLNWQNFETDQLIESQTGQTISEITKGGKSWQRFRKLEQEVLTDLLGRSQIIISSGGGLFTNNVISKNGNFFGQENLRVLKKEQDVLFVLLDADEKTISQRIKNAEMREEKVLRPIINAEKASQVQTLLDLFRNNPAKQKQILIDQIIEDSLNIYRQRKPMYLAMSQFTIRTDQLSVKDAVDKIINWLTLN